MNPTKTWLVTGASAGLGLDLVHKLLDNGYRVAGTSRRLETLKTAVGDFPKEQWLPLEVDLTSTQAIDQCIKDVLTHFGSLDVVVNNAGYGLSGALEETSEAQIRDNFEINVFALINVTKAVLPYFRQQGSGHFLNIASIGGFVVPTGWPIYGATKATVIALSEGLAAEVKELGIFVTAVAPSGFRTQFLAGSLVMATDTIEAYTAVHASQSRYAANNGKQAGDPDKAAEVMIQVVESPNPPGLLFLGSDAYNRAKAKIEWLEKEVDGTKGLTTSADF